MSCCRDAGTRPLGEYLLSCYEDRWEGGPSSSCWQNARTRRSAARSARRHKSPHACPVRVRRPVDP
eukprot:5949984-Prymnesium_polylepis.1